VDYSAPMASNAVTLAAVEKELRGLQFDYQTIQTQADIILRHLKDENCFMTRSHQALHLDVWLL
jgi:hypothetical protein